MESMPATLLEAIVYFSDKQRCHDYLLRIRWGGKVTCPHCESEKVGKFSGKRLVSNCKSCKKQFSVKVGTIFENSPLGLDKCLSALWIIVNAKNGVSSCELARTLGITQKSSWFLAHRIRLALQRGSIIKEKFGGTVEVDESYIGGKARFMHQNTNLRRGINGTGMAGKTAVVGLLERNSEKGKSRIVAEVLPGTPTKKALIGRVKQYVVENSEVHTDAANAYTDLVYSFRHRMVDHAEKYVEGHVHTNGLENFWSLFKRAIRGTYVLCAPFHLHRYLSEQVYRFNERTMSDSERFELALFSISGKKLSYKTLIGKEA